MKTSPPIKHLEIKEYSLNSVSVLVKIDYDKETISLLEAGSNPSPKRWMFAERGIEFMQGWRNILDAMRYAIDQAEADLDKHLKAREKEKIALMRAMEKETI